jgi:hypothetical protein
VYGCVETEYADRERSSVSFDRAEVVDNTMKQDVIASESMNCSIYRKSITESEIVSFCNLI